MKIPENFDVNIFEVINDCMKADIPEAVNIIGSSDIAMGRRKNLIKSFLGVGFNGNAKTLFGVMFEAILHRPEVLQSIITHINRQCDVDISMEIDSNKEDFLEILEGNYLRMHPDIHTTEYTIEVKTTSVYTKEWNKDLTPYQVNQLNTYLGFYEQQFGFLLKINTRAFISNMNDRQPGYWDKLWRNYGYIIPVEFNPEMYAKTLQRAEEYFQLIEAKNIDVECPEFAWECKYCNPLVREKCGKIVVKCRECKKVMFEWMDCLKHEFIETPVCNSCFHKIMPQHNYEKFKYVKPYPWYKITNK